MAVDLISYIFIYKPLPPLLFLFISIISFCWADCLIIYVPNHDQKGKVHQTQRWQNKLFVSMDGRSTFGTLTQALSKQNCLSVNSTFSLKAKQTYTFNLSTTGTADLQKLWGQNSHTSQQSCVFSAKLKKYWLYELSQSCVINPLNVVIVQNIACVNHRIQKRNLDNALISL